MQLPTMESYTTLISDDTICAISTPHGTGGIAVIRISGPDTIDIVSHVWHGKSLATATSHTAHLGNIIDGSGEVVDQAVATVFRRPHSFTGEDVVELSVHGSPYIQQRVLSILTQHGARIAEAGEFTRRAFSNGRIDLIQAEGIADVIASRTAASHRLAMSQMRGGFSSRIKLLHDRLLEMASLLELELDFSEEDVEFASRETLISLAEEILACVTKLADSFDKGRVIKEGIPVTITGETNAGKSTLLNSLLGEDKAIVSDIHGTTRDSIEDTVNIGGHLFRFIDTAGLRDTEDPIESIGISRAMDNIAKASIVIWMVDSTSTLSSAIASWSRIAPRLQDQTDLVIFINKSDINAEASGLQKELTDIIAPSSDVHWVIGSARSESDITTLQDTLSEIAAATASPEGEITVTNLRHYQSLTAASRAIRQAIRALRDNIPGDLVAQDIRETLYHLYTLTGTITTPDLLSNIFANFCIGK